MEFIRTLTEMAAKKICDKCGKTMAANHYWYKGGWRCKGASKADNAEPAKTVEPVKPAAKATKTVAPAPAPEKKSSQQKPNNKPSHPREEGPRVPVSADLIKQAFPEIKTEQDDADKVYWQAYQMADGRLTVGWEHTFKRNTAAGEFKYGRRKFDEANRRLERLMAEHPQSVTGAKIMTPERAVEQDEWVELNGEPAVTEYERSFGSFVEFLVK